MEPKQFRIVLLGDPGVGKTTYINRLQTGEFTIKYVATLETNTCFIYFNTTSGPIIFHVLDTSGQDPFFHIPHSPGSIDGVIGMCDSRSSCENLMGKWYEYAHAFLHVPELPCVAVTNKVDVPQILDLSYKRRLHYKWRTYYDISAKSNYNFEKPFLYLAKILMGDPNLQFTYGDPVIPPEICLNPGTAVKRSQAMPEQEGMNKRRKISLF